MLSPEPADVPTAGSAPLPPAVGAVVFDCDGLLLDTEAAWVRAAALLLEDSGSSLDAETERAMTGASVAEGGRVLATRLGLGPEHGADASAADRLGGQWAARAERELSGEVRAMPGAEALLRTLADRGVPVAVASNSPRALLDAPLRAAGLLPLLPVTVAADEVAHPKPQPDLYLRAFALLGERLGRELAPSAGVAFEDSATGSTAARASGAFVVGVPQGGAHLPAAHRIVRSLADPEIITWAHQVVVIG